MMLYREANRSGRLDVVILHSFFVPSPAVGLFFTERSVWGFSAPFFSLTSGYIICRFSRVGSVVLKVFRYHWGNWNLVETAFVAFPGGV